MHPSDPQSGARIEWRCHTCQHPAQGGGLHIDLMAAMDAVRARAASKNRPAGPSAAFDLAGIITAPPPTRWRVECNSCLREEPGSYTIDLRQCQSVWALLRWQGHLSSKAWFPATDWMSLVADLARRHGSPSEQVGVW